MTDDEIRALLRFDDEARKTPWALGTGSSGSDMCTTADASARNALRPLCEEVLRQRAVLRVVRDVAGGGHPDRWIDGQQFDHWEHEIDRLGAALRSVREHICNEPGPGVNRYWVEQTITEALGES